MKSFVTLILTSFSAFALASPSSREPALPVGSFSLLDCKFPTILGDQVDPWVLPASPRRTANLTMNIEKSRVTLEGRFRLPAYVLPGGETVDSRDIVLNRANLFNVEILGPEFLLVGEGTYASTSEGTTTTRTLDVLTLRVGENGVNLLQLANAEGTDVFSLLLSCRVQNQDLLRRLSRAFPN